jgi:sensor domain CHASE-containing protein
MSRNRTVIVYWVLFFVFVAVQSLVIRMVVLGSVRKIEHRAIEQQVGRFTAQINGAVDQLRRTTLDWAWWDEAYEYVIGKKASFVKNNLTPEVFKYLRINYALITDCSGDQKSAMAFDLISEQKDSVPGAINDFVFKNTSRCAPVPIAVRLRVRFCSDSVLTIR